MTTDTSRPKLAKTAKKTKATMVTRLLLREKGATLEEIMKATGWQAHSCRAFLTGLRKKGTDLVREDRGAGRTAYRTNVPADAVPAVDDAASEPAVA